VRLVAITGALIGRRETFLQGDPDMVGGGTVDIITVDDVKWTDLPDKEEAGRPNVVGAVALAKTMLCLQEIGIDAPAEHEACLTAHLLRKLARLKDRGARVYGITDPARATEHLTPAGGLAGAGPRAPARDSPGHQGPSARHGTGQLC
jgi:cysteine desulfurase/selenocysteine lyase